MIERYTIKEIYFIGLKFCLYWLLTVVIFIVSKQAENKTKNEITKQVIEFLVFSYSCIMLYFSYGIIYNLVNLVLN